MKPTSFKIPQDVLDRLDALAIRHGVSRSEVAMMFLRAGLSANPEATDGEMEIARRRRRVVAGAVPGLVVPLAPMARAEQEKSGGEDGIVRRASTPDLVVLRGGRGRRAA